METEGIFKFTKEHEIPSGKITVSDSHLQSPNFTQIIAHCCRDILVMDVNTLCKDLLSVLLLSRRHHFPFKVTTQETTNAKSVGWGGGVMSGRGESTFDLRTIPGHHSP